MRRPNQWGSQFSPAGRADLAARNAPTAGAFGRFEFSTYMVEGIDGYTVVPIARFDDWRGARDSFARSFAQFSAAADAEYLRTFRSRPAVEADFLAGGQQGIVDACGSTRFVFGRTIVTMVQTTPEMVWHVQPFRSCEREEQGRDRRDVEVA